MGYFWKTKDGERISFREFMLRFKNGLTNITPVQKIKTQVVGTRITLLGLFLGLIVTIIAIKILWWVMIILIGAIINTGVQYLGLIQQKRLLENMEKMFEDNIPNENGGKKDETKLLSKDRSVKSSKVLDRSSNDRSRNFVPIFNLFSIS